MEEVIRATGTQRGLQARLRTAAAFNALDQRLFDVLLQDSRLKHCCFQVAAFVDAYLGLALSKPVESDMLQPANGT